jgi:hypothetical protein
MHFKKPKVLKSGMKSRRENGFILVSTLLATALLLSLLAVYYATTTHELASTRFSRNATTGFYSAEAGLNLRAEDIRGIFRGYNRPAGISPSGTLPCTGTNMGSGDYLCKIYSMNNRSVYTYVTEDASNPVMLTIPPGELYQNLNAQEYRYVTKSFAKNQQSQLEANLELHFRTRLVPLFQFAAFYDKDLEILPGPAMTLAGPVHTNGDLYLNAGTSLGVDGQVTTAGNLWRGRKDGPSTCDSTPVRVRNSTGTYVSILPSCSGRTMMAQSPTLDGWGGTIRTKQLKVVVPEVDSLDPTPGKVFWDKADLRIAARVDANDLYTTFEVRGPTGTNIPANVTTISGCAGTAGFQSGGLPATVANKAVSGAYIWNTRENSWITVLDIDMQELFNCLHNSNWLGSSKLLSDSSDGGLVFHFSVIGNNSGAVKNKYGVRLRNGANLRSNVAGASVPRGVTVVSDQAMYVMGNYNSANKIPAAVLSDSLNILSNAWVDGTDAGARQAAPNHNTAPNTGTLYAQRVGGLTTINSAFLTGTDVTGAAEGVTGQGGAYNGGLENYPRFHENWSGRTFIYRGSFVSLNRPRHVNGTWGSQQYSPPNRDWNYDTSFNNAANLPPLTPRFVYLKQELFVRDFNQIQ